MDLLDKFNFAVDALGAGRDEELKQEEIVYSSLSERRGFSVSEEEFKGLVQALEGHFHHICAPLAMRIELNMVNYFSVNVQYKEVYACVLKNLKQTLSYVLSTFNNRGDIVIDLTSDQIEIKIKDLILKPREDERALFYKIKNNRFYNAQIVSYKAGRRKFYEVRLTGSWNLQKDSKQSKSYRSKDGARKGQWENTL